MRLLLLSNSSGWGQGYLDHAMAAIREGLGRIRSLVFVPFALADQEAYTARVRERFAAEGVAVTGLSADERGREALGAAEAVFVGGGNTFRLLDRLARSSLLPVLRERARQGVFYLGASAGTNLAAPSIRTTNDMPIVEPPSFEALGLVPFQINPHYLDSDPASRHMGETREARILEFLEENESPVLGLREGTWLRVNGTELRLEGSSSGARLFRRGRPPQEIGSGAALDALLIR
jgi:dipeptidase E